MWEAEKVERLTSRNYEGAQHDAGKNKLRSCNTFKTNFHVEANAKANFSRAQSDDDVVQSGKIWPKLHASNASDRRRPMWVG